MTTEELKSLLRHSSFGLRKQWGRSRRFAVQRQLPPLRDPALGPGDLIVRKGGGDFALAGTRFEVDRDKAGALLGTLPLLSHLHDTDHRDAEVYPAIDDRDAH